MEPAPVTPGAAGASSLTGPSRPTNDIATFSLEQLQNFTDNFSSLIDRGGFGNVYRGIIGNLPDSELNGKEIVVKVSHAGVPDYRSQWETEIRYLSYVSHRNILPLLGQCEADQKFYLVYPYLKRGSVKQNLPGLNWERTLDILIGASLSLVEVHRHNLVFRDFKSANILLDDDWTPMLSDFGTVTPEGEISRAGTGGYTDPQILMSVIPGTKPTDIFSLGILILQLIMRRDELGMSLVWQAITDVSLKMHAMDDEFRALGGCPINVARDISNLAIRCADNNLQARPTALEVHQVLVEYKRSRSNKVKRILKLIPKMCIGVPRTNE